MKRQKRIQMILVAMLVFVCMVNVYCQAGSIWAKRSHNAKDLYADDKANQIGDVLTIIIAEDHKVDNKVNRDLSRSSSRELEFDSDSISIGSVHPIPDVSISTGSNKSLNGKSDYKDERSIEDRITVIV